VKSSSEFGSQRIQANLPIVLPGQVTGDGGEVSITSSHLALSAPGGGAHYIGPLTDLYGSRRWYMIASLIGAGSSGGQMNLRIAVQIDGTVQVGGTVVGTPVASGSSA